MTYYNLITAVPAFQKLVGQSLPLPIAYKLSKMIRRVNEEMDFFRSRVEEVRNRHEGPRSPAQTQEENELLAFSVEWDMPPVEIPITENLRLSCADLDALAGFVTFTETHNQDKEG